MSSKKMGRPTTNTVSTMIRLPVDLKKQATEFAEKDDRKLSNWIIKLIREALDANKK